MDEIKWGPGRRLPVSSHGCSNRKEGYTAASDRAAGVHRGGPAKWAEVTEKDKGGARRNGAT